MLLKSLALRTMQTPDGDGKRVPFHCLFLTANREAYQKKKKLRAKLASLKETDAEYAGILQQIKDVHCGGEIIEHDNCVISRPRGSHATKIAKDPSGKNPNNNSNRTRNIVFRPGENIRKLHNSLIFLFNNQEVIY